MKKLVAIALAILLLAGATSVSADIQKETAFSKIQMIDGGPPM